MFKSTLLAGLVIGTCSLSAYAAEDCTPRNERLTELKRVINCLSKRIDTLENGVVRYDVPVKMGFDQNRCLAAPSGVGGHIAGLTPAIEGQRLTLLQDCGGSQPMTLKKQ